MAKTALASTFPSRPNVPLRTALGSAQGEGKDGADVLDVGAVKHLCAHTT